MHLRQSLLLAVILLKVVAPVKVAALGVMAPLQELQVTPLDQVVAQLEVEVEVRAEQPPPLDQVVAHLEVEVEVRRLPRLREARLELAPVVNACRQGVQVQRAKLYLPRE